ncbi:MAG: DUF6622 family protein [Xanthobacteraceae bacterium]
MSTVFAIVQNTPLWAFVVLSVLLTLGVQALRSRVISLWRLLLTPAVFIAWGIASVALQAAPPTLIVDWLAAAALGAAVAWTTTRLDDVRFDRTRQRVSLPGSAVPLIRNLVIFSAKYALAAAAAIAPMWRADIAWWDIAVSGASAGYFLGWLARLALVYRSSRGRTGAGRGREGASIAVADRVRG